MEILPQDFVMVNSFKRVTKLYQLCTYIRLFINENLGSGNYKTDCILVSRKFCSKFDITFNWCILI